MGLLVHCSPNFPSVNSKQPHPFGGARVKRPFWQRKYQSARGCEFILMSMRHWLAGVLARERPALFRALPESFKIGYPLPEVGTPRCGVRTSQRDVPTNLKPRRARSDAPHLRFVHGCELLAV
jgi:hypothetical protein